MKGSTRRITELFDGNSKHLLIPVYQRNYDWKLKHCARLFDDLVDIVRHDRETAQNLHFAVSILSGAEYKDLEQEEESTSEYRSARLGPNPILIECTNAENELDKVAELIKSWIDDEDVDPSTIAVLTRGQTDRSQFVRALGEHGVEARVLDNSPDTTGHVQVLTMHRSKGMEFSRVILASIDDANAASKASMWSVPEEEQTEALLRERSLLYVAASRARDTLVVTWSGRKSALLGSTGE
ncbi:3'-5' exonuclease [Rhodococcus coprophilus]